MTSSKSSPKSGEDHRPWGYYRVLTDEPDHKVKRIVVFPQQRLSLQRHLHRMEHWYILQGRAVITLNNEEIPLKAGHAVDIKQGSWHRIMNTGDENLIFIEIQTGAYFGEDDIERSEDDYGRV
jgi:mannose-6-phosphate isomerase